MKAYLIHSGDPLWTEALQKFRYDTYHLPKYLDIEAAHHRALAEAFLFVAGDKRFFVPYLVRRYDGFCKRSDADAVLDVASPYGYPGILLSEAAWKDEEFLQTSLNALKRNLQDRGICTAFLRQHPILSPSAKVFEGLGIPTSTIQHVSIDLIQSDRALWSQTRKGHRSTINRGIRLGFVAEMVRLKDYVNEFYEVFSETMDRGSAGAHLRFNRAYFSQIAAIGENVHLGIVKSDNQVVAACLFLECNEIVQAHLGGTRSQYLKLSPFHLLIHHARLWAKERNNKVLYLGGGIGDARDGVYTFKSGFSKQRSTYSTLRLVLDENAYLCLVRTRAKTLGTSVNALLSSKFFPAYRSA